MFPIFFKPVALLTPPVPTPTVRPELKLKYVQNPHDPLLLNLPTWKPSVQPIPRVSRMKLTGVHRSLTPHNLKPLPPLSYSLESGIVVVEQVD
jgi:hypothetical protein